MNKNINIEQAKTKGLITNDDSLYQKVVDNYKYVLEYYLSTIIDFKKYETDINNSKLYIGKINNYNDINKYLRLDYLCLLNNLFIEKLDQKDLDLLINYTNINDELIDLVKRTFKEVIKDNYFKGEYTNQIYKVCYGPMVPFNFVNNNSLVFKFVYGKNLIDLNEKEFIKLDKKQHAFINKEIDLLKKEIKNKLNVDCEVLIKKDIFEK